MTPLPEGYALRWTMVRAPLVAPYRLSFATLDAFDTAFVAVEAEGRIGAGEITPLPGYSEESPESVRRALARAAEAAAGGSPVQAIVAELAGTDPFVASGIACAAETWHEGAEAAFARPLDGDVPLVALCPGETPEDAARAAGGLAGEGYRTLKLKVGTGDAEGDIARVRAAAGAIPDGVRIRVDANQRLAPDEAATMARALAALPVELMEQPFPPDQWDAFAALARSTDLPLMLDESIGGAADVERAAECDAAWVKLKLCKHPGMAATAEVLALARECGLGVVFGNGVQTALGNHLEARLYRAAGLGAAGEMNGFLKVAAPPLPHAMRAEAGILRDGGLPGISDALGALLADAAVFNA